MFKTDTTGTVPLLEIGADIPLFVNNRILIKCIFVKYISASTDWPLSRRCLSRAYARKPYSSKYTSGTKLF